MLWYLKQLLPLTYVSQYGEHQEDGTIKPVVTIWRMWFGRCFNIRSWEVVPE